MQEGSMTTTTVNATPISADLSGTTSAVAVGEGMPENMMFQQGPQSGMIVRGPEQVNSTLVTAAAWASIASAVLLVAILFVVIKIYTTPGKK
jgi:hypothetical protein